MPFVLDPHVWIADDYRLCVSDRLMAVLRGFDLRLCDVSSLDDPAPMQA